MEIAGAPQSQRSPNYATKLKMDHEAEIKTMRLTSEIIRCIAKSLLASADELERSLWHCSIAQEQPRSSGDYGDALDL